MCPVKQYERKLKQNLNCFPKTKSILIGSFRKSLEDFLIDTPNPTFDALVEAFGTPEEMATTLMADVSGKEIAHRKVFLYVKRAVAVVLILLFLAFSFYIYVIKSIPVIVEKDGKVVSEVESPDGN